MTVDGPVVDDGAGTQRAPGDGNGVAVNRVVDDFVVLENPRRIGAGAGSDLDDDDLLVRPSLEGMSERLAVDALNRVFREQVDDCVVGHTAGTVGGCVYLTETQVTASAAIAGILG